MSVRVVVPCRLAVAVVLVVALALAALSAVPALAAAHGRTVAHAAGHHRHAVVISAAACADSMLVPAAGNLDRVAAATLCLINQQRAGHGLAPLQSNAALTGAAAGHSREMVARNYFDHVGPSGSTPLDRIRQAGYLNTHATSYRIAENIAAATGSYATPAAIVRMWMNSAGHRANILNAAYRDTGLGIAPAAPRSVGSGAGGTYTEDFGSIG